MTVAVRAVIRLNITGLARVLVKISAAPDDHAMPDRSASTSAGLNAVSEISPPRTR